MPMVILVKAIPTISISAHSIFVYGDARKESERLLCMNVMLAHLLHISFVLCSDGDVEATSSDDRTPAINGRYFTLRRFEISGNLANKAMWMRQLLQK
jgi:hypothetical protein